MAKNFVRKLVFSIFICFFPGIAIIQAAPGNPDTAYINRLNAESFDLVKSDPDSAMNLALEAIRLSEASNYLMGFGDAYVRLGIIEKDKGNYDKAVIYYKKSLEYRQAIGDRDLIARVYNNLGAVFTKQSRYDSAAFYLLQALREAEALQLKPAQAMYSMNLGIAYEKNGDIMLAFQFIRQARTLYEELQDSAGILKCMINEASVHHARQDHLSALPIYRASIELAEQLQNEREKYLAIGDLALIYMELKRPDSALFFMRQSLDYYVESENTNSAAINMSNLGLLFIQLNLPDSARYYFTQSLQLSEEIGDIRLSAKNAQELAELFRIKGDYKKAFDYQEKYIQYNDSVFNQTKSEAIAEMQTRFESEKKESKIKILNKDMELKRQELSRKSMLQQFLVGGIFLILIITVLVFSRFRLKKQIEQQQALLSERKRISSELHDDLGAQLSTAKMFLTKLMDHKSVSDQQLILENSLNLIEGSIGDLRRIMDDLQASTLQDKGLIAAIEELVNRINQLQEISFVLSHHGLDHRLESKTEHQLFRITQELVNNTLKYAMASHVTIDFTARDGEVILVYEDNGKGFDTTKVKRGYGLSNIESRARSLGGSADFDSRPGAGCIATIEIPLENGTAKN